MKDTKLLIAVITVAVVWGTTFLGIKLAVDTIPPWFVAGFRQLLAALILGIFLFLKKEMKWIGRRNFFIQIILSSLMLVCANGLTTVAETSVSSSLASLISSMSPILVFIGSVVFGLEKFTVKSLIGLVLGFSGAVLIFWNGLQDLSNPQYLWGMLLLFASISGWAAGTVFTKKIQYKAENLFLNLFYQFSFAGVVQLVIAFFSEDFSPEKWSPKSISAMVYLALFGSIAAYFAFNYCLKKLLPTQVSMLSYINTIIAIILGWLILNEEITLKFVIAALCIITGVFITNYKPGMLSKTKNPA